MNMTEVFYKRTNAFYRKAVLLWLDLIQNNFKRFLAILNELIPTSKKSNRLLIIYKSQKIHKR